MAYKIIDIEGIGEAYAAKLEAAGVKTPEDLLAACASAKGRKEMAEKTEISEKLILRWTNHADLFRIKGVGPQFAELLEAAGVDTVKEFRHRVAANLQKKMEENIALVNVDMPNYQKIAHVRIMPEEFEKTPKKSIKRYMYQ